MPKYPRRTASDSKKSKTPKCSPGNIMEFLRLQTPSDSKMSKELPPTALAPKSPKRARAHAALPQNVLRPRLARWRRAADAAATASALPTLPYDTQLFLNSPNIPIPRRYRAASGGSAFARAGASRAKYRRPPRARARAPNRSRPPRTRRSQRCRSTRTRLRMAALPRSQMQSSAAARSRC